MEEKEEIDLKRQSKQPELFRSDSRISDYREKPEQKKAASAAFFRHFVFAQDAATDVRLLP